MHGNAPGGFLPGAYRFIRAFLSHHAAASPCGSLRSLVWLPPSSFRFHVTKTRRQHLTEGKQNWQDRAAALLKGGNDAVGSGKIAV
jgi:hypothetical protein